MFSVLERFRCQPPDRQPIRFSGQVKQVIISHFCNTRLVNCKIVRTLFLLFQSKKCTVQNHGMENFGSRFSELQLLICQYYKSIKIFVAKNLLTSCFCKDSPNPISFALSHRSTTESVLIRIYTFNTYPSHFWLPGFRVIFL